jgi:uroporphyrin-3 C-methyltransferase
VNIDSSEIGGDPPNPVPEQDSDQKQQKRGGGVMAFFAFLTALAALAGTSWLWWQSESSDVADGDRLESEVARLESNDSRLSTQLQELQGLVESRSDGVGAEQLDELRGRVSGSQAEVEALQATLQEQVALTRSLQLSADAMHGRLLAAEAALAEAGVRKVDARSALDLAEVDYLLRMASERLQLFDDPAGADHALALAEAQLAALDNPAYLGVRQAITVARQDLAAVEIPDGVTISGELNAIQEAVPSLPFRQSSPAAASPAPEQEQGWWEKLKSTFASLVTVRRSTEEENLRISLQDEDYIRQHIWLQMDFARLAFMRRDQTAFRSELGRAQAALAEWFDPDGRDVRSVGARLEALLELDVTVAWPDISAPWTTLKRIRSVQAIPVPSVEPAAEADEQPMPALPVVNPAADEDSGGEDSGGEGQ